MSEMCSKANTSFVRLYVGCYGDISITEKLFYSCGKVYEIPQDTIRKAWKLWGIYHKHFPELRWCGWDYIGEWMYRNKNKLTLVGP